MYKTYTYSTTIEVRKRLIVWYYDSVTRSSMHIVCWTSDTNSSIKLQLIFVNRWNQNFFFFSFPHVLPIFHLKRLSGFFSKMLELFSGTCRRRWLTATTKGLFFSKLPYLQMSALQSWSGCQPVLLRAGCKYSCQLSLYPHWLNIGWRLFNDWLRISRYQISAHFTR